MPALAVAAGPVDEDEIVVVAVDPTMIDTHRMLAEVLWTAGRYEEAIAQYRKDSAGDARVGPVLDCLAREFASGGPAAFERAWAAYREKDLGDNSSVGLATAYAELGDRSRVFACLDRAVARRDPLVLKVK
jgi:tetratricopeptide (TPR) repeat protein